MAEIDQQTQQGSWDLRWVSHTWKMWRSRCDGEDPLAPLWWKHLGTIEKSSKNPWELRFWLEKKQEKTHRFEGELMFLFRNVFFLLRWVCAVPTLMGMSCVRAFIHLDFGAQERGLALKHQVQSVRLVRPDTCLTQKSQNIPLLPLKSQAGTAVGRQGEDATLQGLPLMEMAGPRANPPKNEFVEEISSTFVPKYFELIVI